MPVSRMRLRYPGPVDPPREAQATDKPCELHVVHRPVVVRTQGHHVFPIYLQKRLYDGAVRHGDLLWLCGTGHDSLHAWLGYALGEAYKPAQRVGTETMERVAQVVEWYRGAA
jgi:hypothetical protein